MRCRLAQVACLAPVVLFGVLCSCDRLARLLQARGADGPPDQGRIYRHD